LSIPVPGAEMESLRATSVILSGATGARLAQILIELLTWTASGAGEPSIAFALRMCRR
jgi:hypothetical protein